MFKRLARNDDLVLLMMFFEKIDNGYKFAIVRAYRNNGVVDVNSARTIRNARAAGLKHVDASIFPCISCGDASQQVRKLIIFRIILFFLL